MVFGWFEGVTRKNILVGKMKSSTFARRLLSKFELIRAMSCGIWPFRMVLFGQLTNY